MDRLLYILTAGHLYLNAPQPFIVDSNRVAKGRRGRDRTTTIFLRVRKQQWGVEILSTVALTSLSLSLSLSAHSVSPAAKQAFQPAKACERAGA